MDYSSIAEERNSQHAIDAGKRDPYGQAVISDTQQVIQVPVLENGIAKHHQEAVEEEEEIKSYYVDVEKISQAWDVAATFSLETSDEYREQQDVPWNAQEEEDSIKNNEHYLAVGQEMFTQARAGVVPWTWIWSHSCRRSDLLHGLAMI